MTRRCDDCGAAVSDTIGSRQCSLFDPPDTRIDPTAAACIRSGRILCPACARGVPLLPEASPAAVAVELADGEAEVKDEGPGGWQGRQVYRGDPEAPEDRARRTGRRRNKNWRGDANAEAWDRARAAGRR